LPPDQLEKTNSSPRVKRIQDNALKILDRLPAIVMIGRELESQWATNNFALSTKKRDRYKTSVLWKNLSHFIGASELLVSKEGDSRVSEVEILDQEYKDRIRMDLLERKQVLEKHHSTIFNSLPQKGTAQSLWFKHQRLLTSPAMSRKDLDTLGEILLNDRDQYRKALQKLIDEKLDMAKVALGLKTPEGLNVNQGFLQKKEIPKVNALIPGTFGIPKNVPLKKRVDRSVYGEFIPRL